MYIRSITLTNWKAYKHAAFEFPTPTDKKNIVLIGAQNGYGKTSLFQAILLGIYGEGGFELVTQSPLLGGGKQHSSYSDFIKSVLHKNADPGNKSCSVKITLEDDNNIPVEIYRNWYFTSSGDYLSNDESVEIYEGVERRPVGPPTEAEDRAAWYRDYVARILLPSNLSSFFWFDGEKASIFAEHDMAEQVKMGINGLLGVPIITQLADNLRGYASNRRKAAPDVSDDKIDELEKQLDTLQQRLIEKNDRLGKTDPEITRLKYERDNLTQEIATFGVGSQADTRRQMEKVAHLESEVKLHRSKLENLLANDMALALAGNDLRKSLFAKLESESIRDKWEAGKQQGDSRLDAFLGALDQGMLGVKPNIDDTQRTSVLEIARTAWEKLWFPPPENCASNYLHPYLNESDRVSVRQHLLRLREVSAPLIIDRINSINTDDGELKRLRAEISRLESVAPHIEKKRTRLNVLNSKIGELDQEIGSIKREKQSLEGQINKQKEDLGRLYATRNKAKPISRKIARAMTIEKMIREIVSAAVPSQIEAIANAMTIAYKDIAHKETVEKIDIDDRCTVKLLDVNGNDMRNLDASAGEKQIFTQALISAVSSVSGRAFPTVIDTPLGRLDDQHRMGVLQHLAKQNRQVILLTTDTEVVGEYLDMIESSVQKKYLINYDEETGISSAVDGYFNHGTAT